MSEMPEKIWCVPYEDVANGEWSEVKWVPCPYIDKTMPPTCETEYIRSDITGLQCFYDYKGELPDKFIALYSDGSGCEMYFRKGVNWYPAKDPEDCFGGVDKQWFMDAGHLWFIALPDDFKMWGEDPQKEKF